MTASKIKVLDEQTINQIAAGEVIENPASVVKELVENALDADASHIVVEIQQGGHSLIRISDNGYGMSCDDALLSLERHATSKIREAEDIHHILTMGFRGEALPSIASISKFSLLTTLRKENEKNEKATFISVEGGRILSCKEAVRSAGTTIEVKSLFYNTPARRKFQKSPSFDEQEVARTLERLSLAHPSIQFELIADQKTVLKTPLPSGKDSFLELLKKRIESVLGREIAQSLLAMESTQGALSIKGYIGSPHQHKPNKKGQYLFINERPVISPMIAQAIKEGYGTMLAEKRYPLFILHLKIPGALLDVNVHPQKKEVRLRQESHLKAWLINATQTALNASFSSKESLTSPLLAQEREGQSSPSSFFAKEMLALEEEDSLAPPAYWGAPLPFKEGLPQKEWALRSNTPTAKAENEEISQTFKEWDLKEFPAPLSLFLPTAEKKKTLSQLSISEKCAHKPTILGTLTGFCILEPFDLDPKWFSSLASKKEGGLCLLDQRAAYFRIRYEQILKKSLKTSMQTLLVPLTLELSREDFRLMQSLLDFFGEMGFQGREFGHGHFLFDAIPSFVSENELEKTILFILNELKEGVHARAIEQKQEEKLALIASRALIPRMTRLSIDEAKSLIEALFACEMPAFCPCGKPIFLYFSPDEVSRWFTKIAP